MMDKLENAIESFEYKTDKYRDIPIISESNMQMAVWLKELKQRRESDLRPADKFLGNGLSQQMYHVNSEFAESIVAYDDLMNEINTLNSEEPYRSRLIEELVDLQMSCETMLAILGLDEEQRREARRKVIAKNEDRGYYRKGEE